MGGGRGGRTHGKRGEGGGGKGGAGIHKTCGSLPRVAAAENRVVRTNVYEKTGQKAARGGIL